MIALALALALQDSPADRVQEWARRFEPRRYETPPDWAVGRGEPLARVGLLADIHYYVGLDDGYVRRACRFLNAQGVAATFVLGDNVWAPQPEGFRAAHEALRAILEGELSAPFHVLKGDNDGRDFEATWGSTTFAVTVGGVRWVATGLAWDWEMVGLGGNGNLPWVLGELWRHRERPVVLLTHVPVSPPIFGASSIELEALLAGRSNVRATVAGHIHMDLEWTEGCRPSFLVPSVCLAEGNPVKVAEVYEDGIVLRTYELRDGEYVDARKYQRVDFGRFRAAAAEPDLRTAPARPTEFLPGREWLDRAGRWLYEGYRWDRSGG